SEDAYGLEPLPEIRGDSRPLAAAVRVEPFTGLPSELPRRDEFLHRRRGREPRLLRRVHEEVDPHLVRELERPHRETDLEPERAVDHLLWDPLLLVDPRGLEHVRSDRAARDEARDVLAAHDGLLLQGPRNRLRLADRLRARVIALDDLDE